MSRQDQEKIIINIILESDFFPNGIKNEIRNFRNWGYKLEKLEIERNISFVDCKKNNGRWQPIDIPIKFNKDKVILIWDKDKTIVNLNNENLGKFNLLKALVEKRKEG
jgi:hypothetical protein